MSSRLQSDFALSVSQLGTVSGHSSCMISCLVCMASIAMASCLQLYGSVLQKEQSTPTYQHAKKSTQYNICRFLHSSIVWKSRLAPKMRWDYIFRSKGQFLLLSTESDSEFSLDSSAYACMCTHLVLQLWRPKRAGHRHGNVVVLAASTCTCWL